MKLRFIAALVLLIAAVGICALWLLNSFIDWSEREKALIEPVVIDFSQGQSLRKLSENLAQAGMIDEAELFELWVRLFEDYTKFQAGTYRFEKNASPDSIIKTFMAGKIFAVYALEITIPEGFTFHQIAERLVAKGAMRPEEIFPLLRDSALLAELKIPSPALEGFLFPATYRFARMPAPKEFVAEAVKTFWEKLPKDYEKNLADLGLSLKEGVIFASLIEAETPIAEEKPMVSEVIWNRLKSKEVLGIDSAVIYGIDDYQGDLKKKHLADAANPYNTRIHPGLPPTPICSPSAASLQAVLTPSRNGYLYYVLDPETKQHHFSKTIEEHNAYVRKLVNHRD